MVFVPLAYHPEIPGGRLHSRLQFQGLHKAGLGFLQLAFLPEADSAEVLRRGLGQREIPFLEDSEGLVVIPGFGRCSCFVESYCNSLIYVRPVNDIEEQLQVSGRTLPREYLVEKISI